MSLISFPNNQGVKKILQLAFVFWLSEIVLILFGWKFFPTEIPLFYSRPWGQEQLTKPLMLFILPALGLVIFFLNLVVSSLSPKEEKLMRQILAMAFLVFNFLSLVTLVQIMRLVI
jgi:hypothetical protein